MEAADPGDARAWWSLLVLVTGYPGLLAFLSVNTFPAREACPQCGKLRVVSRKQWPKNGGECAPGS